ncbi:MAG: methionyl-tRNA formyltransferase [Flavobacteriales bacterium]|jgi:methionyl-tRNA formyltransferase
MKSLRIVFMGTPEFAVASLEALHQSAHHVVGVVTVADKPAGRGLQMQMSAVKQFAVANDIPVLQPLKLRDPDFLEALAEWKADLFVIVAFRMLPEVVWQMPPMGSINLHGSLLPRYRGAAPINRAIMNGDRETGVTTFFLQHEIDTGRVIRRETIAIGDDMTAGELHDVMMIAGARVLVETVDAIADGSAEATAQENLSAPGADVPSAPKIFKEDCKIDWTQSVLEVHNHVRGLSPYPAAWTEVNGKLFKIYRGIPLVGKTMSTPFETDGKGAFLFRCADGAYSVLSLQPEGKKRMDVEEFLRGWRS